MTNNGLAFPAPTQSQSPVSISLVPAIVTSSVGKEAEKEVVNDSEQHRFFVKCCLNAAPLANRPYRLYLSRNRTMITGNTDDKGVVDTIITLASPDDRIAFLEVDIDALAVVLYRMTLTLSPLQSKAIVCNNLGLRCFSGSQRDALEQWLDGQQDLVNDEELKILRR